MLNDANKHALRKTYRYFEFYRWFKKEFPGYRKLDKGPFEPVELEKKYGRPCCVHVGRFYRMIQTKYYRHHPLINYPDYIV